MVDFSIEYISNGEKSLRYSLDSIRKQSYNSFEIVCANSSPLPSSSKLLEDYEVKYINVGPVKHLRGRELSHTLSKGTYSFIMDSTRVLHQDALEILKEYAKRFDIVAIKEGSLGSGFWVNQAQIYKNVTESNTQPGVVKEKFPSYVLPRLYNNKLITNVFNSISAKIPEKIFNLIGYGEHHIISQEALLMTNSFYYYKEQELVKHFEDESIRSIYRKYKSYGRDQIILKSIKSYYASSLFSHRRNLNVSQIKANVSCFPLISLRTFSFFMGMFF